MVKNSLLVLLPVLLLTGCTSVTNLTPRREARNPNGSYTVEMELDSRQQTMRWDSIHPSVMVGKEAIPMQPTKYMTNRWETIIPGPTGGDVLTYRYIIDYNKNTFGAHKPETILSPVYKLQIVDH